MKKTKLKHRTRKFISFALAVCLLTGMLSVTASALTQNEAGYAGLYNKFRQATARVILTDSFLQIQLQSQTTKATIPR